MDSKIFKAIAFPVVLLAVLYTATTVTAKGITTEYNVVECLYRGIPVIGPIPNTSPLDCTIFFICSPAHPNSTIPTTPVPMVCPEGPNGTLFYNFRECRCDDRIIENCYNWEEDSTNDIYGCTKPFDPNNHDDDIITTAQP